MYTKVAAGSSLLFVFAKPFDGKFHHEAFFG
jgi:hypothetical protein